MNGSTATTPLVTGAGGAIGIAIARALAAAGHRVLVTDLDPDRARRASRPRRCLPPPTAPTHSAGGTI
jgi:NAD(P)-dependent dehydrogenase (short-subunit alcohol dehydrogenase family)